MVAFVIKVIGRIIIGLLWARFVLVIFAVKGTGFIWIVYELSRYLSTPFQGIFRDIIIGGRWVLESTTLLAIVVYAFIEFLLVHLVQATRRDDY